jgi:hypothetical protein
VIEILGRAVAEDTSDETQGDLAPRRNSGPRRLRRTSACSQSFACLALSRASSCDHGSETGL